MASIQRLKSQLPEARGCFEAPRYLIAYFSLWENLANYWEFPAHMGEPGKVPMVYSYAKTSNKLGLIPLTLKEPPVLHCWKDE